MISQVLQICTDYSFSYALNNIRVWFTRETFQWTNLISNLLLFLVLFPSSRFSNCVRLFHIFCYKLFYINCYFLFYRVNEYLEQLWRNLWFDQYFSAIILCAEKTWWKRTVKCLMRTTLRSTHPNLAYTWVYGIERKKKKHFKTASVHSLFFIHFNLTYFVAFDVLHPLRVKTIFTIIF